MMRKIRVFPRVIFFKKVVVIFSSSARVHLDSLDLFRQFFSPGLKVTCDEESFLISLKVALRLSCCLCLILHGDCDFPYWSEKVRFVCASVNIKVFSSSDNLTADETSHQFTWTFCHIAFSYQLALIIIKKTFNSIT